MIYHGKAEEAINHFDSIGFLTPKYSNPADHFLHVMQQEENTNKLVESWKSKGSTFFKEEQKENFEKYPSRNGSQTPFWTQFIELTKRSWKNVSRNKLMTRARFVQNLIVALILSLVLFLSFFGNRKAYVRLEDDQNGVQNRLGLIITIIFTQGFSALLGTVHVCKSFCFVSSLTLSVPMERDVILHEYRANTYGILPYFLGKFISELPYQIFFPVISSTVIYWIAGFRTDFVSYLVVTVPFFCFFYSSTRLPSSSWPI